MKTDFSELGKMLEKADIEFSASFVHGLLSAFCCKGDNDMTWAVMLTQQLDPQNITQKEALNKLNAIKIQIDEDLSSSELDFHLLLESMSGVRNEAISTRDWANGFWLGAKKIKLMDTIKLADSTEFFQDLQKISAMPIPSQEENETLSDLFEIQEYLRMGVLSLYLS